MHRGPLLTPPTRTARSGKQKHNYLRDGKMNLPPLEKLSLDILQKEQKKLEESYRECAKVLVLIIVDI